MRKGNTGELFAGVILCLAAITAVQPVLAPLHLALADHAHRYNTVSGLYEDVTNHTEANASASHVSCLSTPSLFADTPRSHSETTYTVCPISNLIHLRYKLSPGLNEAHSYSSEQQSALFPEAQAIFGTHVYMTAPKQSPPFTLG